MKRFIVIIISLVLIGCKEQAIEVDNESIETVVEIESNPNEEPKTTATPSTTPTPTSNPVVLPADNLSFSETTNDGINRPIITHKADVVYFNEDQGFMDFSENVKSVVDEEDGDILYENIGGIEGPYTKEEIYKFTHCEDNIEFFKNRDGGLYFSISYDADFSE